MKGERKEKRKEEKEGRKKRRDGGGRKTGKEEGRCAHRATLKN